MKVKLDGTRGSVGRAGPSTVRYGGDTSSVEVSEHGGAVLVLEPSADGGALKTGRKGVASYRVELEGRASHAGLEPEKGINAVLESAHEIIDTVALDDPDAGTTVTPTIVRGGTAVNVIPELATIEIDVRAASRFELDRVDAALNARSPRSGARRRVERMSFRPPLEQEMSARLFEIAQAVARDGALPEVTGVVVGGGSDGNFTAAAGTPTLDGLGAVGDGAHAPHEAVDIGALPARLELLRGLIDALLATEA